MSRHDLDVRTIASPIPRIRLAFDDDDRVIMTRDGDAETSPLPPFPLSLLQRLVTIASMFYHRHGRCLGLLLVLDVMQRTWGFDAPLQTCGVDGACWRIDGRDLVEFSPHHALGGTFQLHGPGGAEELVDAVPPVEGLHFVQPVAEIEMMPPSAFVRAGGTTRSVPYAAAVVDDWNQDLEIIGQRAILD